jgi:hypothetical protein
LSDQKSTPLTNVCDICDLENIVKCATCFTKGADPILIDVILTNRKSLLQNVMNFSCGLSDVHNLIAVQIKGNTPSIKKTLIKHTEATNNSIMKHSYKI